MWLLFVLYWPCMMNRCYFLYGFYMMYDMCCKYYTIYTSPLSHSLFLSLRIFLWFSVLMTHTSSKFFPLYSSNHCRCRHHNPSNNWNYKYLKFMSLTFLPYACNITLTSNLRYKVDIYKCSLYFYMDMKYLI